VSGFVDESSARQLGKILGVDAIVSGTVANFRDSLGVNARVMSTETGEILATASTYILKDEAVETLWENRLVEIEGREVSLYDVTIKLEKLERTSKGALTCHLAIRTTRNEEQPFAFVNTKTALFEESGTSHSLVSYEAGGAYEKRSDGGVNLIPKVPFRLRLRFGGVPSDLKKCTLVVPLVKFVGGWGVEGKKAIFEGIPVR
jgi:hypothetical protein